MQMNKSIWAARKGDSSVMLSAAKQLPARRERPFAALRVTGLAGALHTNLGTPSR